MSLFAGKIRRYFVHRPGFYMDAEQKGWTRKTNFLPIRHLLNFTAVSYSDDHMRKQLSLYWICQLAGWGTAAIYWSYHQIPQIDSLPLGILSVLAPFLSSILSTHLYRQLAHQKGWIRLDLRQLLPIMFLALVALTMIYLAAAATGATWCYGMIDLGAFLGMLTGGTRYLSIWLLAFHLYHFARHSRQAEIDQSNYEKLAIAAQFKRLNSELNPHFLFNSLNSIKALILENPAAARQALDLLSDMLRNSLRFSNQKRIPLAEEIKSITAYLALEKIRFEERLQYQIDIPEEFQQTLVPPLSLYNLVENAVKHGIAKSKSGGRISISAKKLPDSIHLTVLNDGQLSDTLNAGIGLKNTRERLELVYGPEASLELRNANTKQVSSSLTIPAV